MATPPPSYTGVLLLYTLIRSYSSQRNGETFRKQYKVQIYKIKRTAKRKLSFNALRERERGGDKL